MSAFIENHRTPYAALDNFVSAKPLVGKSVLVTGAGKGVGKHITRELAAAGASQIAILGRDSSRINSARDRFAAAYPSTTFTAFSADITDEAAIAAIFSRIGTPDILVNNAGHFPDDGPFVTQDLKHWWSGFEINILGTAIVTQQYLRALASKTTTPGVVLNVSSMAAHMRFPLTAWAGYNSSKLGGARIFESLRFEHPDVKFLNIHPGQIESDGFTRSGAPAPEEMTDGSMAGKFFAWAATQESDGLSGRFLWAEWDIEELKAKKQEILDKDLLLFTVDGFTRGF